LQLLQALLLGGLMKIHITFMAAALTAVFCSQVHAQQITPAPSGCFKDLSGKISCPPLGGELHVTLSGQAVCGKGRCVRDPFGKITCSSQPGGRIIQDASGQITCVGSCEEASAANCQQLP
jgi:hypothetical protein